MCQEKCREYLNGLKEGKVISIAILLLKDFFFQTLSLTSTPFGKRFLLSK